MSGTLKYIKATILQQNTVPFFAALGRSPLDRDINCDNVKPMGVEYFIPEKENGMVIGYTRRMDGPGFLTDSNGDPIINDSIKALRLWNRLSNETIWIALEDNQSEIDFTEFCNQCCGQGNDFTVDHATLALPILEETACATPAVGSTTYTYRAQVPPNPFSSNITLANFSYNGGQPPSVAIQAGGYASVAAAVTWLNTNLGALGTWSNDSGQLKLVSTTVTSINLNIDLLPKTYCLTVPGTAFTATTLVVTGNDGTTPISIPITPITTSVANAANVAAMLRTHLDGVITVVPVSTVDHVQYVGLQKPVKLTDGTTNANFASGAC